MTTKLTLTIEEETIKKAKVYAKGTQRSLSEMVQNYLDYLVNKKGNNLSLTPIVDRIAGSLPLPDGFDSDPALDDYYAKKYKL
ncbi:DUF6364 family protein [Halpernia sp. GG3]